MSVPFFGKPFTFTQPDGTPIQVRGWGDQHHAAFETPEGYTIVKDPTSGFYHYATISDDREALVPTGVRPGAASPKALGLEKGLRISAAAARARHYVSGHLPPTRSRWQVRREERRMQLRAMAMTRGIAPAPPKHSTVGDYVGLTILVQFPDVVGTIPATEVENFCNASEYSGFGNNGSVYDYFYDNSGGQLKYTNIVTPYYTARYPRSYYTNELVEQPRRAWQLIKEALDDLKAKRFDFSKLSTDGQGYVYALNVFYAGPCVNNWAKGLWPHSYHLLTPYKLAPGKQVFDYQISDIGSQLTLGTFCHENGHMICDFPDLYDYGYESNGVGLFCLMCAGANVDERNPVSVCAYLKAHAGWVKATPAAPGVKTKLTAGGNEIVIYEKSPTEYFMVENRYKGGRDQALSITAVGATADEAKDRVFNERYFYHEAVSRAWWWWRWYYAAKAAREMQIRLPLSLATARLEPVRARAITPHRLAGDFQLEMRLPADLPIAADGSFLAADGDMRIVRAPDGSIEVRLARPNLFNLNPLPVGQARAIALEAARRYALSDQTPLVFDRVALSQEAGANASGSGEVRGPYTTGTIVQFRQVINGLPVITPGAGTVRVFLDNDGQVTDVSSSIRTVEALSDRPRTMAPVPPVPSPAKAEVRAELVPPAELDGDPSRYEQALASAFSQQLATWAMSGRMPLVFTTVPGSMEIGYDIQGDEAVLVAQKSVEVDFGEGYRKLYRVTVPLFS